MKRDDSEQRPRIVRSHDYQGGGTICKQVSQLNDNHLEDQIRHSTQPLLVDIWAEWCGPCRAVAPILEELGDSNRGRATIGKLDVDENTSSASRYRVQAIPTLILFKDRKEQERLVGAQSKQTIMDLLDRYAA